jgi:hypothetical protein
MSEETDMAYYTVFPLLRGRISGNHESWVSPWLVFELAISWMWVRSVTLWWCINFSDILAITFRMVGWLWLMNGEGCERNRLCPVLRYCHSICLAGLVKTGWLGCECEYNTLLN